MLILPELTVSHSQRTERSICNLSWLIVRIENCLYKNANFIRVVTLLYFFGKDFSWLLLVITKQWRLLSFLANTFLRGPGLEAAIYSGKLCRKSAPSFEAMFCLFVCLSSRSMSCTRTESKRSILGAEIPAAEIYAMTIEKYFRLVFVFLLEFGGPAVRKVCNSAFL